MPQPKLRTKKVKVRFFRAVKASHADKGWLWPANDDARGFLVDGYDRGIVPHRKHDITYWGRQYQVVLCDGTKPPMFRISAVRENDLPIVGQWRTPEAKPVQLGPNEHLLEPAYLTFFDDNVVTVISRTGAPSANTANAALCNLLQIDMQLVPFVRPDVRRRIERGDGLSRVDLAMVAGSLDAAMETASTTKAAANLSDEMPGVAHVGLTLKADTKTQQKWLRDYFLRFLDQRGTGGLESVKVAVRSDDFGAETLDLLETHLTQNETVIIEDDARQLLAEPAHEASVAAHAAAIEELEAAMGLTLEAD